MSKDDSADSADSRRQARAATSRAATLGSRDRLPSGGSSSTSVESSSTTPSCVSSGDRHRAVVRLRAVVEPVSCRSSSNCWRRSRSESSGPVAGVGSAGGWIGGDGASGVGASGVGASNGGQSNRSASTVTSSAGSRDGPGAGARFGDNPGRSIAKSSIGTSFSRLIGSGVDPSAASNPDDGVQLSDAGRTGSDRTGPDRATAPDGRPRMASSSAGSKSEAGSPPVRNRSRWPAERIAITKPRPQDVVVRG